MFSNYDRWKLATPPHYDRAPKCAACEDAGCPECCETVPVTLADLVEMDTEEETARREWADPSSADRIRWVRFDPER